MKSIPIALISNRDEFRGRISSEIQGWDFKFQNRGNQILGPRDEQQKGTWFACENKWKGCWATLTNIRDFKSYKSDSKSRGEIITHYLQGNYTAKEYLKILKNISSEYNYFNLIFSDSKEIIFFNSKSLEHKIIYSYGDNNKYIYGLSNGTLDSNWPKVSYTKELFFEFFKKDFLNDRDYYWSYFKKEMCNSNKYKLPLLPNTGAPEELEVFLSSLFINGEEYGTRSTLFFGIESVPALFLYEQTYNESAHIENEKSIRVQYDIL